MVADSLFYYHAGSFYRQAPSGYVIVSSPIGAVVPALPVGFGSVVVNGVPYFSYGGVYYRQVVNGYQVVPAPAVNRTVISGNVVVTAAALNVRSGPNAGNRIIGTLFSGNVLNVAGGAPGWYYVQLPDQSYGWVMAKFTAPMSPPADG